MWSNLPISLIIVSSFCASVSAMNYSFGAIVDPNQRTITSLDDSLKSTDDVMISPMSVGQSPKMFDLRDENVITSVKDQYQCSTCVAFALTATIEGSILKQTKQNVLNGSEFNLSEQSAYFCRPSDRMGTDYVPNCATVMTLGRAVAIAQAIGFQTHSAAPYDTFHQTCQRQRKTFTDHAFEAVNLRSFKEVRRWMRLKGPVMTLFAVPDDFIDVLFQLNGVYYRPERPHFKFFHAVSCVGYDNSWVSLDGKHTGAWICKNSWGEAFGQEWNDPGYFRIAYKHFVDLGFMSEVYGFEVVQPRCTRGVKVSVMGVEMDACDAARLANEEIFKGRFIAAQKYMGPGLLGYGKRLNCGDKLAYNSNFSSDMALKLSKVPFYPWFYPVTKITQEFAYELVGCTWQDGTSTSK